MSVSFRRNFRQLDVLIAAVLSLAGLIVRWPNYALIPVFQDETRQALWAMQIWPGGQTLLSGMDSYTGPVFSYLLAGAYALFGLDPGVPRALVMVLGALTVGLTYVLARALGLGRWGSLIAAGLLLVNPQHVLVNSHLAWSNSIAPVFTTATLIALALSARRNDPRWLPAAGLMAGLAMQAHPVVALIFPGIVIWYLLEPGASRRLRAPWPYLAVLAAAAAYGVVIIYNSQIGFYGVQEAQLRSYIWQENPSVLTYVENLRRLTLQLAHVSAGALQGGEELSGLLGVPILYALWLAAALVYATRGRLRLPLLSVAAAWLIMPYFSHHYGTLITTRLTNHLTPPIMVMMGAVAEALLHRLQPRRVAVLGAVSILTLASIYPLLSLASYYADSLQAGHSNTEFFPFAELLRENHHGSPVYLSESLNDLRLGESGSVLYVMDYFLGVRQIPHETLTTAPQILERLLTRSERRLLVLHERDAELLGQYVSLKSVPGVANDRAAQRGYALYIVEAGSRALKPEFVFSSVDALTRPPRQMIRANFENTLELWGTNLEVGPYRPGDVLSLTVYWRALRPMDTVYTGFAHLLGDFNPVTDNPLWGQDDHELGRGLYRTIVWQPDEIIVEEFQIAIQADTPPGRYLIEVGAYNSQSIQRLMRLDEGGSASDDRVILGNVEIVP